MENDSITNKEEKSFGELNWTKLATIATGIMAAATIWLALETHGLMLVDLNPYVAVTDVQLQIIDNTGTVIKQLTWLDGEQQNKDSVRVTSANAILSLKFSNSGKSSAYVKFDNYQGVLAQTSNISIATSTETILVPGGGFTGWSYGINIISFFKNPGEVLPITYKFSIYDVNGKLIDKETFIVTCKIPISPYGGVNPSCSPSLAN